MNYGIWMNSDQQVSAGFETTDAEINFINTDDEYNDGRWHYTVLTYDGTSLKLYIDGMLTSHKTGNKSVLEGSPDDQSSFVLRIGASSLSMDHFIGYVDEIRIWDRVLQYIVDEFDVDGQVLYLPFENNYGNKSSLLGTFYYPWYGGSVHNWHNYKQGYHDPPYTWNSNFLPDIDKTKFDPLHELYDSFNATVIKNQLEWMILPSTDNPHPFLKWVIYYEKEGYGDPSMSNLMADLNYIKSKYASSPYRSMINQ